MDRGKLRLRITIDDKISVQDETGDPIVTWIPWAENVPADLVSANGKEFAVANQILAQAQAAFLIPWIPGVLPTMRVRHGDAIWNIVALVPDRTHRESIKIGVVSGTNQG